MLSIILKIFVAVLKGRLNDSNEKVMFTEIKVDCKIDPPVHLIHRIFASTGCSAKANVQVS